MSKSVLIRYTKDVPARDGRRAFVKGEEHAVASAAVAAKVHPDATIVGDLLDNYTVVPVEKPKAEKVDKTDKPEKAS